MSTWNELVPNTDGVNNQGRLAHTPSQLLPPTIVGPIFDQAQEHSLVMKLGRQIPVTYGETVIPTTIKRPEVGQVGTGTTNEEREGAVKPLSGTAWATKSFSPIKLATIVTVSDEFAKTDPAGLYTQLQGDLAYAIGRGIDLAVFHGKSPLTGGALTGIDTTNVISNTPNTVNLVKGNIYNGLLDGYDIVNNNPHFEFDGWAVDPRFRSRMLRESIITSFGTPDAPAVSLQGANALDLSVTTSQVLGLTAHYGRGVNGDLGAAAGSGIKVIGGDFQQLAYGFADQIRVKVTDQASISDGTNTYSMWQTNQIAILIEVTFGWILGDYNGFVSFTDTGTASDTVTLSGQTTGASFSLKANGVDTGQIAATTTSLPVATTVKSALLAVNNGWDASLLTVAGSAGGPFTVTGPFSLTHGTDTVLTSVVAAV